MCKSKCLTLQHSTEIKLKAGGMEKYDIPTSGWGKQVILGAYILCQNDAPSAVSTNGTPLASAETLAMAYLEVVARGRKSGVIAKIPLSMLKSGECCFQCLQLGDCTQLDYSQFKIVFPKSIDPFDPLYATEDATQSEKIAIEIHWLISDEYHPVGNGSCGCGMAA